MSLRSSWWQPPVSPDGCPGGAVYRIAAEAPSRQARTPAQLFAVGRAERELLSHQRQARAAWRRRGLHRYGGSGRRYSRRERAARQLYVAAGRARRGPGQRGHRRDPSPRYAARTELRNNAPTPMTFSISSKRLMLYSASCCLRRRLVRENQAPTVAPITGASKVAKNERIAGMSDFCIRHAFLNVPR